MINLGEIRRNVISIVQQEGPLLPIHISRKLEKDTIFAGAVLSELVKEKIVKITSAKIGGSPLYYVNGQESKLEKLYDHLPGKEKEAFNLLSAHQVLRDKDLEPAIRVALRSIRDFSFSFEVNSEIYWRWYLVSEEEARKLVKPINIIAEKPLVKQKVQEIKLKIDVGDTFQDDVTRYFRDNNIEFYDLAVVRKKREVEGIVKVNSDLGVLEYFFIARNKKKINEADLSLASDRGRKNKRPVLFLSNGDLSKKALKYLEDSLKSRVIFRKVD